MSTKGTQLLFVTDSEKKLRAYTLSIISDNKPSVLKVDATSTAYSLLMLTPGITTTDPEETQNVLNNFSQIESLPEFINYLRNNLPYKTLGEIIKKDEANSLLEKCIIEYKYNFKPIILKKKKNEILGERKNYFEVNRKFRMEIRIEKLCLEIC